VKLNTKNSRKKETKLVFHEKATPTVEKGISDGVEGKEVEGLIWARKKAFCWSDLLQRGDTK